MKQWKYFVFILGYSFLLNACVLENAGTPQKKELFIIGDILSKNDSLVIHQFGKKEHVKVHILLLNSNHIRRLIAANKFNTNFDVILISDESLRTELHMKGLFRKIENSTLFTQIDRQFYVRHQNWLPISFNPLVLSIPKDSLNKCDHVSFKKWQQLSDSIPPKIMIDQFERLFLQKLTMSRNFNWITAQKNGIVSNQTIEPLNQLIANKHNSNDSIAVSGPIPCRYYLIEKKRYIATENSISIYRYARNSTLAEQFLSFYAALPFLTASSRNALPCNRTISSNSAINQLTIQ
jgi:hypothetical protein